MTTLANQNPAPIEQPNLALVSAAVGNGNTSGSITQGGINPSAAAMLILYEVMAMYSKITGINAQEQKTQISATQNQAKSEAKAVEEAGVEFGTFMIIGASVTAATSIASAGVGIITTKAMDDNNADSDEAGKELGSIKSINEMPSEGIANAGVSDDDVIARKTELKGGKYQTDHDDEVTQEAIKQMASEGDLGEFKERLNLREQNLQRRRNTNALNNENSRQTFSSGSQMVNSLGQAISSGVQGGGNMKKAKQDANAALDRSAAQMSQQAGSSIAEAKSKSADAQNSVMNILSAIRQASSNV